MTNEESETLALVYKSKKLSLSSYEWRILFRVLGRIIHLEALEKAIDNNPATKAAVSTLWEDKRDIEQGMLDPFRS